MIKQIIKDADILEQPVSREPYTKEALAEVVQDLKDTATHAAKHPPGCLGLASNQIGHLRLPVIVVRLLDEWYVMINPVVTKAYGGKNWQREACLSFPGKNTKMQRNKRIRVNYVDEDGCTHPDAMFSGFKARVIQHEIDHLNGIHI